MAAYRRPGSSQATMVYTMRLIVAVILIATVCYTESQQV